METKKFVMGLAGIKVFAMVITAIVLMLGAADKAYPTPQPAPVKTYVLDEDLTPDLMNNLARNMPNWITTYLLNNTNAFTITAGESLLVQGHARVRLLYLTENMIFTVAEGDTIVLEKVKTGAVEATGNVTAQQVNAQQVTAQNISATNVTSSGVVEAADVRVLGSLTIPTPTMGTHAATKAYAEAYADALEFSIPFAATPPTACSNTYEGTYYTDTDDWKIRVCNGSDWVLATNTGNEGFPAGTSAPNAMESHVATGYEYVGIGTQAREVGTATLLPSGTSVADARALDVLTGHEFITIGGTRTTGTLTSYLPTPTSGETVAIASNVQDGTQFWLIDPFGGGAWTSGTLTGLLPSGTSAPDASPGFVRSGYEYVNIGTGARQTGTLSVLLPSGTSTTDAIAADVRTNREFVAYGTQERTTGTGGDYFVPSGTSAINAVDTDVRSGREYVTFTGARSTGILSVLLPSGTSTTDAIAADVRTNREFVAYGTQERTTGTGGDYFVPSGTSADDAIPCDVMDDHEYVDFLGNRQTGTLIGGRYAITGITADFANLINRRFCSPQNMAVHSGTYQNLDQATINTFLSDVQTQIQNEGLDASSDYIAAINCLNIRSLGTSYAYVAYRNASIAGVNDVNHNALPISATAGAFQGICEGN